MRLDRLQSHDVIPAQAGIHLHSTGMLPERWMPAFAGMTQADKANLRS
jgi:hypothetical protein